MLNKSDINFLITALDKISVQGIQSNMKVGEVFLKLSKMLETAPDDGALVPDTKLQGEDKVSPDG